MCHRVVTLQQRFVIWQKVLQVFLRKNEAWQIWDRWGIYIFFCTFLLKALPPYILRNENSFVSWLCLLSNHFFTEILLIVTRAFWLMCSNFFFFPGKTACLSLAPFFHKRSPIETACCVWVMPAEVTAAVDQWEAMPGFCRNGYLHRDWPLDRHGLQILLQGRISTQPTVPWTEATRSRSLQGISISGAQILYWRTELRQDSGGLGQGMVLWLMEENLSWRLER